MVYLNDEKIVNGKKVYKYHVDTEADLAELPKNIGESSSALVYETGVVAFLNIENGVKAWRVPEWMR